MSGFGESTVWKLIHDGDLETVAIGRRRLVLIDSYRRLIEKLRQGAPQDARRNSTVPSLGSTKRQSAPTDLTLRVDELALSTRATNCLLNDQLNTLGQICKNRS
jgi:hypothetical protein